MDDYIVEKVEYSVW